MIVEGLVTTVDLDGKINVAPMGPIVEDDFHQIILRPFQPSTTFNNLAATRCGVFHVVDQVDVIAKAAIGGYDGKGTIPLSHQEDLEALLARVDPRDWILEELVPFYQELAMVACRDQHGTVACFPLVETHQHQQVCEWVVFPAAADHAVRAFARNVAASVLTALDYVGVMGIEFFYGRQGLQVN